MASEILNGNDFHIKGQVQVDAEGRLIINSEFNPDYSMALVSRDVFDFTGGTKSLRYLFSATPYKHVVLDNKQVSISESSFVAINRDGVAISVSDDGNNGTVDVSIAEAMKVSTSNQNTIIVNKDGIVSCIGDNTNNQLDANGASGIADVAAGDGFVVTLGLDGTIVYYGDNASGNFDIPISLSTFDEQDKPIKIDAGDNFILVLRKDASVEIFGTGNPDVNSVPEFTTSTVDISCGNNFCLSLSVDGKLAVWGIDENGILNPPVTTGIKFIKAGNGRASVIANKTFSWGENVIDPLEINSDTGSLTIMTASGSNLSIGFLRDGTFITSGSIPTFISSRLSDIGKLDLIDGQNQEYRYYPILKETDGLNIAFGIQDSNLDNSYNLYLKDDGTIAPIIVGNSQFGSVFESMHGGIKGAILAKAFNGKDAYFDLSGESYDPFSASGHRPVSNDFVTTNEDEMYEAIISFGPFGKMVKFRKISGGYANEMPFTSIELNNNGYAQARVAIYIRGAENFTLHSVEVTDEIDSAILPPEIIFRDMDTAVLQTRAAQSMIDIINTMQTIKGGLVTLTDSVIATGENHREKIEALQDRVTELGG